MAMGKRPRKGGGEADVFSPWRYLLCWTQRAGAVSDVKKAARRRERRQSRQKGFDE